MRYRFTAIDPALLESIQSFKDLLRLFQLLVLQANGDVDRALEFLRSLQQQGYLPEDWDLEEFERQLENQEIVQRTPQGRALTKKGERSLRKASLEQIFGGLMTGGPGGHPTPHEGTGSVEQLPERRPYQFGDDPAHIDFSASIMNSLRRGQARDAIGPGAQTDREGLPRGRDTSKRDRSNTVGQRFTDDIDGDDPNAYEIDPSGFSLREEDLTVAETEHLTSCATVILIDVSHSMVLYGEDRITPAKQVALALSELILTRYQKDALDVVLFGDEAMRVEVKDLPYIGAGPFHTNTQEGLRFARKILERRHQANKQIFLITDGKPTVIRLADGRLYRNVGGLDPIIVARTLDEAVACRRRRIPITTFMVARDPYLQRFVEQLTERNKGRAYFTSLDRLGSYLLVDFLENRRRKVR